MSENKKYFLSEEVALRKLTRMVYEIVENNMDEKEIILAGIKENGLDVAKILKDILEKISTIKVEVISVALNKKEPKEIQLSENRNFNNAVIILVDDVANSGKTLLYALKPFLAFSPKKIQVLILVDRSHKKFPIHPDYKGVCITSTLEEHIIVEVENNKIKGAYLC